MWRCTRAFKPRARTPEPHESQRCIGSRSVQLGPQTVVDFATHTGLRSKPAAVRSNSEDAYLSQRAIQCQVDLNRHGAPAEPARVEISRALAARSVSSLGVHQLNDALAGYFESAGWLYSAHTHLGTVHWSGSRCSLRGWPHPGHLWVSVSASRVLATFSVNAPSRHSRSGCARRRCCRQARRWRPWPPRTMPFRRSRSRVIGRSRGR